MKFTDEQIRCFTYGIGLVLSGLSENDDQSAEAWNSDIDDYISILKATAKDLERFYFEE